MEKRGRLISNTIDKDLILLISIDGKNGKESTHKYTRSHLCPILTRFQFSRLILANPKYKSLGKPVILEASCSMWIEWSGD